MSSRPVSSNFEPAPTTAGQMQTSPQRIVLLAEYYNSGGTRTFLRQLLDFYSARGTSVVLVSCHRDPDPEVARWLALYGFTFMSYAQVLGMDAASSTSVHPNVWSPVSMLRERAAFRQLLKQTCAHGIVVSAGTPGQFAGAAGSADSGIYILHTYPHGRRQELLGRWIMHWFFRRVRRLVAVSHFQRQAMAQLWRMNSRSKDIAVIPNTTGRIIDEPMQTKSPPLEVVTASWLEPYKQPLEWLEVAAAVSQQLGRDRVRFTWLGEGSMLEVCREAASRRNDQVDATYVGHSDDVDVVYIRAHIYLQLSSTENMSLSTIDALRFGLPTVATDVGGLPEIVVDGVTGLLVPVHDVNAAAEAVTRLLDDPSLCSSMAAASRDRYTAQFAPDLWYRRMTELHDEVFGAHI
jgi:glycosyltransferase involved in cell wall biosynthesis